MVKSSLTKSMALSPNPGAAQRQAMKSNSGNDDFEGQDDLSDENMELEDEFQMEQEPNRLTSKLEKFKGQEKSMKIGRHKFQLNDKDPIFLLNGPNNKKINTESCVSCVDHIFENVGEKKYCQFCG